MDWKNRLERWMTSTTFLVTTLLVGLAFILLPVFAENTLFTVLRDFGIAFFTASFLGLTVERLLSKQLAKDAFRASMGYLLPEELRPELKWVYSQEIVATKHVQICEIEPLSDDLVTMSITLNRTLKNVTNSTVYVYAGLSIDEGFHEGNPSRIVEFGWRSDTGEEQNQFECEKGKRWLNTKPSKIGLGPGGTLDTWCTYVETKSVNDEHILTLKYATEKPLVNVKAFEGLEIEPSSVEHYQMSLKKVGENRYEFNGTLLPGHPIIFRWWKIKDSERFQHENT